MPEYQSAGTIFCFVGTGREIDTRPILRHALNSGKTVCVPLCTTPGQMELRRITALEELRPGKFHIPEPPADAPCVAVDEVDLAILPCLSCNHLGQRLGRGGGYYDRFLAHYRGGTVLPVPGAADPGGDSPGATRLPRPLGADGAGPLRRRLSRPAGITQADCCHQKSILVKRQLFDTIRRGSTLCRRAFEKEDDSLDSGNHGIYLTV